MRRGNWVLIGSVVTCPAARALLRFSRLALLPLCITGWLRAQPVPEQTPAAVAASGTSAPAPAAADTTEKRVLGVFPNYRTADGSLPYMPISAKRKLYIAYKDSTDYPVFYISAFFAGIYQLENQTPAYGQGVEGFGKRYAAAYGDQAIGNIFAEGIFPALLHEDNRYFRRGSGPAWGRLGYAASRVLRTKNDQGKWGFNYAEWLGNGTTAAISNLYYEDDTRNAASNVRKVLVSIGTDALSNVLKEFGPDIKRKLRHAKAAR